MSSRIKVWVRTRPTQSFATDHIEIQQENKTINLYQNRQSVRQRQGPANSIRDWSFKFDGLLQNVDQEAVFEAVGLPMVTDLLKGYNGTILCYGQTGAGKTFTMTGTAEYYKHRGLIPRVLQDLYRQIDDMDDYVVTVRASYLEIYNEQMFDLLASVTGQDTQASLPGITEEEGGVRVKGLSTVAAPNEEEAMNLLFEGETNRAIGGHILNKNSSRSHCIFTIHVETRSRVHSDANFTVSKLNLVDLAGSERLNKTQSAGKTQQEAMYINKSLSFLEQVVIALTDKHREHIPFRQCKLTHILKDAIGGNCQTVMIANIWPEYDHLDDTISTFRFAKRMMCIPAEPAVNVQADPAVTIKRLEQEIHHLRKELAMKDALSNHGHVHYEALTEQQMCDIESEIRRYLEGGQNDIEVTSIRQVQAVYSTFRKFFRQLEEDLQAKFKEKIQAFEKLKATLGESGIPLGHESPFDRRTPVDDEEGSALDTPMVGEPDGRGFGVGVAPKDAKAAKGEAAKVAKLKRAKEKEKQKEKEPSAPTPQPAQMQPAAPPPPSSSQVMSKEKERPSPTTEPKKGRKDAAEKGDQRRGSGTPLSPVDMAPKREPSMPQRPGTPPPKDQAFDEFKSDKGADVHKIFIQNKDTLASKKRQASYLAKQINSTKLNIDQTRIRLEDKKNERIQYGDFINDDGETVIDEEEFLLLRKMQELKLSYRTDYDEFRKIKSEINYCQRFVDQCRQKLIQDFENWYAESFIPANERGQMNFETPLELLDDPDADKLLTTSDMYDPQKAPFLKAHERTQHRHTYEAALAQPQPSFRKKPGTPTKSIRNPPPSSMAVV